MGVFWCGGGFCSLLVCGGLFFFFVCCFWSVGCGSPNTSYQAILSQFAPLFPSFFPPEKFIRDRSQVQPYMLFQLRFLSLAVPPKGPFFQAGSR